MREDLKDPKFWASVCALLIPVVVIFALLGAIALDWDISEASTFVAGYGGTLAALSGFLYIYVSFMAQQEQFAAQQEQFRSQEDQFERQSFESGLYRLLDRLKVDADEIFPKDPGKGKHHLLKDFQIWFVKNNILHLQDDPELDKDDKDRYAQEIKKIYENSFKPSIRSILTIMKSFVAILTYINLGKISNKDNYYNYLFSQLSQAEMRAYFYGYFYDGFQLTPEEKLLIKNFFLKFEGRELIRKHDIYLY